MPYHPLTWLAWLAGTAFLVLSNQQPLHTALVILAAGLVFSWGMRRNPMGQGWRSFLQIGLWVWALAVFFNLLFSHAGNLVLLRLPASWPLIGGAVTCEALLYGLSSGASLFATLLVFAAFNVVVDRHRLLRWIPAGLYQAGLIVSIALAFMPQMMSSFQSIREAQTIRGHRIRGIRDMVPLLVPLVTTALERSLILAESMESRGFGGSATGSDRGRNRRLALGALGMLATVMGLLLRGLYPRASTGGWILALAGTAVVIRAVLFQGKGIRRSFYRKDPWRFRDGCVLATSGLQLGLVLFAQQAHPLYLVYDPYPPFSPWPVFSLAIGLAACLTAMPILLLGDGHETQLRVGAMSAREHR
jgi:energy-coupling factor transport system permease protein